MRLKRLISAFIACAMLVTFMPMQAFATPRRVNDTEFHIMSMEDMKRVVSNYYSAGNDIEIEKIHVHADDETAKGLANTYVSNGDYWWVQNALDLIEDTKVDGLTIFAKVDGARNEVKIDLDSDQLTHDVGGLWQITEIYLKVSLKYDFNGGTGSVPQEIECVEHDLVEFPDKDDLSRDSAVLLGFSKDKTEALVLSEEEAEKANIIEGEFRIDEDTTLYAVWAEDKNKNGKPDYDEPKYTVTYTDGAEQAAFKDRVYSDLLVGMDTPNFDGTPSREGFEFAGWEPKVAKTVTEKATYTAQWVEDEEPVKSTNGYFYVLKPGSQGDLTTTDPQHFYYVGRGSLQETPQGTTDFNNGVADQIKAYPNATQLQSIGAKAIADKVGTNFENVFWYRVSQASGANGNPGYENPVSANTLAWHVDGILKPKSPNYQVRFILKQGETETVLNVYDIASGNAISDQNIKNAANKALQIGNPGAGHVVRWTNANGQVVTDEQIIADTSKAQPEMVLVFYAEFVQPAMPTVQEALAGYKKTVTAPESVETFQQTAFKFKLEKQNGTEWEAVEKATYQVGGVTYSKLCTVPVSQPVENLTIAGTNDDLQPGTYRLTEVQTKEELKHWAKNNQQFEFTVTNDGKIVRTDEETVFKNTYLVPKLSVTKQLSKVNNQPYRPGAMVSVGDTLTYTVAVENTGNVDLNNVTVTDTFTGRGAPPTSTPNVAWTQQVDGSYKATWSVNTLDVGADATLTYAYTVTDADKGKTITNTAVAGSSEITENKPQDMISVNVATDNQITVNYYSNNTDYGTVSAEAANKVFTFTEGEIATAKANGDKLPVRKLHAQATETSDGDFDRWTSSDFGTLFPVYRATLDVDVTFTVDQLGKTLEVVANFDRETGGGGAHHPDARDDDDDDNDRDDDDEEEIIDEEVPLAETPWLNTEDHYAYIIGYSEDGTVRPNANISRAEVATIFFRLLTDEARDQFWMTTNNFSDVLPNDWYNNAVSTMVNMGIIQGYEDGTFRPNANITRAEFAAIAARFMASGYGVEDDLFTDIANHWARESINDAAMAGWINGYEDGTFRPDAAITRAEAVTLVNNVLQRKPDADHMFDSMIKWPDNPESAWYYEAIQEATNSHDYDLFEDAEYETWTALQENRDWAALEKDWVNTHRTGGEVA